MRVSNYKKRYVYIKTEEEMDGKSEQINRRTETDTEKLDEWEIY